jgi:hypothetical protein
MKIKIASVLSVSLALGLGTACSQSHERSLGKGTAQEQSSVLSSAVLIAQLDQATLSQKLSSTGIVARNGAKIYRVSYNTFAPDDSSVQASGLIIIPDSQSPIFPWISLQHGTVAAKAEAPTQAPNEGLAEASQGFVAVVPDYLGYGDSADLLHPYIIEKSYVAPLLDMMRAAREFAAAEKINLGPLFLKGYSEGGYATLALQKAIESDETEEFKILASAPGAGPYDVDLTGTLTVQKSKVNPANIPLLLLSYNYWLADSRLPLASIFVPSETNVTNALNGAYNVEQISQILPTDTYSLFNQSFVEDFASNDPKIPAAKDLHTLLKSQSLTGTGWAPKTQTRLYHCVDDEQIPVAVTEAATAEFKAVGAPVEAVLIPSPNPSKPYRHGACPAIFAPIQWFGQILSSAH